MTSTKATTGKLKVLRIAIYLRFSQDRSGEGLGLSRHEPHCRKLAEQISTQRGAVAHITVYTDNDISASAYSRKARKAYRELCDAIGRGEFDVVIAYHDTRLIRQMRELEDFIALIEQTGTEVHFCTAGRWDLATASGRMQARIGGAVAQHESELKSERIKLQRVQQATAGKPHGGMRPYGFEADGLTVRPGEAQEVVRMYEQVVAGVSLRQIVADLNRRGIPTATARGPWSSASVRDLILRHRNAGWRVHQGEMLGKAQWPALVGEDTWHAAVAVVTDAARRTTPGNTPRWLGSGIYLCGVCETAQMRVSATSGNRAKVYRCKSGAMPGIPHVNRDALRLDGLVEETVVARLERPDAIAQLTAGQGAGGGDITAMRLEQAALRQRLDSLADMFATGEIDRSQLTKATGTLTAKVSEIDTALASLGMRSPLDELAGKGDIRAAWFGTQEDRSDGLSLGHRRAIVDMLVTVTVLPSSKGQGIFSADFVRMEWKQ